MAQQIYSNKSKKVRMHFEKRAEKFNSLYEFERQSSFWKYFNKIFRKGLYERAVYTFQNIGDLTGKTVLDVGCGSGRQLVYAAANGAEKVTGIDFSQDMLDIASKFAENSGVKDQVELIKGDFLRYTFSEQFDVLYALGVFDYITEPVLFLKKMRELSNQIVVASLPGPSLIRMPLRKVRYAIRGCPVYFYSQKEIESIAEKAGFKRFKIDKISSSVFMFCGYSTRS